MMTDGQLLTAVSISTITAAVDLHDEMVQVAEILSYPGIFVVTTGSIIITIIINRIQSKQSSYIYKFTKLS